MINVTLLFYFYMDKGLVSRFHGPWCILYCLFLYIRRTGLQASVHAAEWQS